MPNSDVPNELRAQAIKCRALARNTDDAEARRRFLEMADAWEQIAREREQFLRSRPGAGEPPAGDGGATAAKQ